MLPKEEVEADPTNLLDPPQYCGPNQKATGVLDPGGLDATLQSREQTPEWRC